MHVHFFDMENKEFKKALKEASEWNLYATEYELSKIPFAESRKIVLKRIYEKYK